MSARLNQGDEWRETRHDRRLRQRRLPHGVREDVARVRRDDLAGEVLDLIDERMMVEAEKLGGTVTVKGEFTGSQVVMPVVERTVLRRLNADEAFRGWVRNEIAGMLRREHLLKTDPSMASGVPVIRWTAPAPQEGVLHLRASIGLGTASYLEAEPEEWSHYVIARVVASQAADQEDVTMDAPPTCIYSIGAGAGGIARAVAALESHARITVEEHDQVLPESTALPSVLGARTSGLKHGKYDAVVMALPSPAMGGPANHRRIYRGDVGRGFDLSALGPRRWIAAVEGWLHAAGELLATNGQVFALVPASIRHASGYTAAPELLDTVLGSVAAAGLEVLEQHQLIEVAPVNQPFVGHQRPERWSLMLRAKPVQPVRGSDA